VTYPIINIPQNEPTQLEQLGTKSKFWYWDENKISTLFKEGRPNTGENWAEKISCEICVALNLPHAHYEFAEWGGKEGVISPSFVPKGGRLILGNELLGTIIQEYEKEKRYLARQHTVRRVIAIASSEVIGVPIDYQLHEHIRNAADVFTGYLMLDALISNQDRHHENWGLLIVNGDLTLAPTFDHASSLGRNESDDKRRDILKTKDRGRNIESYVKRAKSAFFQTPASKKPLSTIDAFLEAVKLYPESAKFWIEQLENIDFEYIINEVPEVLISDIGREFALELLVTNKQRLFELEIID
jgi:hypothetical protein